MLIDRRRSHNPDPPAPRASDATEVGVEPAGPSSEGPEPLHDPHRLLLARVILVLAVALAFSSEALVSAAERQAFGPKRAMTLTVAQAVDDQMSYYWLDRPARLLRSATGRAPTDSTPSIPAPSASASEAGPRPSQPVAPRSPATTIRASQSETSETTVADSASQESNAEESQAAIDSPTPRPIDSNNELRIWAGGDSLGEYVGNHILAELADEKLASVELDYRISTGLARPDYFDWPARLADAVANDPPPDVLLFMVGGNDNQNMERDGEVLQAGTEAWSAEYEARIMSIVAAVDPAVTQVVWIGLPPMRDSTRHELALLKNGAFERVAERFPHMSYVDIEQLFAGPGGSYSPHIAAPDGQLRLARQADGVHITFVGSTWVAAIVWDLVEERWNLATGSDPTTPSDGSGSNLPR
ncbi:MAG: DUF459 domain-containing protein [Acidimicrobiales bacterium]